MSGVRSFGPVVRVGKRESKAMADQITAASKERLQRRIDSLDPDDLRAVQDAILLHLGIPR